MRSLLAVVMLAALTIVAPSEAGPVASGQKNRRLVFVGSRGFAPYQYVDANGEPRGFNVELLRALGREAGIGIEIRLIAGDQVLPTVERGEADLVSFGYNDDRARRFTLLLPLWRLRQGVLFRRDRTDEVPRSIDGLHRETVVVAASGMLQEDLKRLPEHVRPRFLAVDDYDAGAAMVRSGAATLMIGNALAWKAAGLHRRFPDLEQRDIRSVPYYLATGSGRTDLVPMFFSAYARLQESGELNAIVERTLVIEDEEHGWRSWATQLAAALAIVGLALLAMYAWSRSLRRQVRERTRELEQAVTDSREAAERVAFHAEESRTHARRQAAIAVLGQRALAGIDFELLVGQSCATAADVLGVPLVGLFEQIGGQSGLMLKAGLGWTSAESGKARASTNPECHLGYVFSTKAAVVASHGDADPRFAWEPLLSAESVVSSAAVVVPGREGCAGLIVAAAREPKMFTRDDLHFLQALANVIGASLERQLVEDELRRMLSLHRATLESTADGLIIVDHDFRVTSYNQRFAEMWQIRREILESGDGERILDAAVPLIDGDPHAIAARVRAAHRGQDEEILTLTLKDGRVIERYSMPQRLGNLVIGRIWSFRDITARVTAQAEQRRLEVQIQHVQKLESLGVLAGGIAHDFNNLLVGILGHVGLALTDATPKSALYERIAQIEIAAMRAAELTNQMLAYSGKGRFVVQLLDLSLVVREMSNLLQTAVTKTARLDLRLGEDLPAIQADPVQLRQVVMNLITNASDAIGEAQGVITVSTGRMHATREYLAESYLVSQVADGEYVYFDVRDDGCGMDEETRARIFDPFFTTKFTGRGLGLAAVLGIVRGHHGAIRIESTPGKGTAFRVLFPAAAAVAIPEATAPASAAPARRDGCILVVDDEPSVLAVARETLKRAGFTVLTASDGLAAVEQFRNHAGTIDLVLMDMTMPRMSGVRAMHAIRAIRADACVMLTSGYTEQEAADRIDGDAPDGFIQKPYRPAALVQKIQDTLAGACPTIS